DEARIRERLARRWSRTSSGSSPDSRTADQRTGRPGRGVEYPPASDVERRQCVRPHLGHSPDFALVVKRLQRPGSCQMKVERNTPNPYPRLVDALRLLPRIRPVCERLRLGEAKHEASLSRARKASIRVSGLRVL